MPEIDHVTGLATRAELHRFLARACDPLALAVCDVVGLKDVNEREGFLAGDAMLRRAADRLRERAGDAWLVARLGGDELVAIFAGPRALVRAEAMAAAIAAEALPAMRAAAVMAAPAEPVGSLIERAYAAMRRS